MIKRRISIVLIIGLAITLIIVLFKYLSLSEELNWQQTNVNNVFANNLKSASRSFGDNPITADKNENYNYNHAISQIGSAFQLFQFTTYKNDNNGLLEPLDNLCNFMKRDEYKGIIMQKSNLIRDELSQLSNHPEDKQATENLNKLVEVIRQTNLLVGCVKDRPINKGDENISSKTIAIGKYFGKPYSITSSFLPILTLKDNNEFKFELGIGMSIEGTYTVDNNKLVLTSSGGVESYVFGIAEHTLIIEQEIPNVKENTKFVLLK